MEKKNPTIEVDTNDLSDSVIEELVEEGGLDKETAEELGNDVWFDEVDMRKPQKTGFRTYLNNCLDTGVGLARQLNYMYREHKTVFAEVKKVERTHRNYVKIIFEHQRIGEDNFVLSPDSVELINLLTYYSVENPKDLVGEKIILDSSSFSDLGSTVIIPHNVAWNGKLRFAMFSFFSDLNEKSKWQTLFNNGENEFLFAIFLFPCTVLSLLGVLIDGIFSELLVNLLQIPIVLWCALVVGWIGYGMFRLIILLILSVLDSNFNEV